MSEIITFTDVSYAYDGHTPAIADAQLSISQGEFVSIVGPNGGGKTTLLKLMLGLLKPDSGTISIFGAQPRKVRPRLGYVPQHARFDALFPVTVRDVVRMGLLGRQHPFDLFGRRHTQQIRDALQAVDLMPKQHESFSSLSGGQQQRVLIARALVSNPELLILDEPTANLDVHVQKEFYKLLETLNRQLTVVMVSHDMEYVSKAVTSVICVHRSVESHPTCALDNAHNGIWPELQRVMHHVSH